MLRKVAALVMMGMSLGVGSAYAQEANAGPSAVEVTFMPASAAYFAEKDDSPSFGNIGYGSAVVFNINRFVGIEGEFGSMIATTSDLQFGDLDNDIKAPNMLSYNANAVISLPAKLSVIPYATIGVGGLTMFERPALGVLDDETFLTGNVGGGVKWFASNRRWGIRGDYRFAVTQSKDDAPAFFGRDTRYAHRVYGGIIINTR